MTMFEFDVLRKMDLKEFFFSFSEFQLVMKMSYFNSKEEQIGHSMAKNSEERQDKTKHDGFRGAIFIIFGKNGQLFLALSRRVDSVRRMWSFLAVGNAILERVMPLSWTT